MAESSGGGERPLDRWDWLPGAGFPSSPALLTALDNATSALDAAKAGYNEVGSIMTQLAVTFQFPYNFHTNFPTKCLRVVSIWQTFLPLRFCSGHVLKVLGFIVACLLK